VSSYKIIIDSIGNGYDTQKRVITFKFDNGFKLPVYVSYLFSSEEYPDLYKTENGFIKSGSPMYVNIQEDLSLKVDDSHLSQ